MGPFPGGLGWGVSIGKLVAAAKSSGSPGNGCLPGRSPTGWMPAPSVPPDKSKPSTAPARLKGKESSEPLAYMMKPASAQSLNSTRITFPNPGQFQEHHRKKEIGRHLLETDCFSFPLKRLLQGSTWLGGS